MIERPSLDWLLMLQAAHQSLHLQNIKMGFHALKVFINKSGASFYKYVVGALPTSALKLY